MATPGAAGAGLEGATGGGEGEGQGVAFQLRDMAMERTKISLQQAARDGREEIVKIHLLHMPKYRKEKLVNAKDGDGFAAIHYAARFNRFKILNRLISHDADPELESEEEKLTPLHFAARYIPPYSDEATVQQEAQASLESVDVTHLSSSKRVVQYLVQICRVNVNCQDRFGVSPLHLACARNNVAAVEILLSVADINPCVKDDNKDTPLHEACLNGNKEVVEKLLEWMSMEQGLEIAAENDEKQTPLHLACREGEADIVKLILQYGFSQRSTLVHATDNEGGTPLHLACDSGSEEIVRTLLLNGADINCTKDDEVTPLHMAAERGFVAIAELLLSSKDDNINSLDVDQCTPLHFAAEHNKVEMIKFLLEKGADPEALDRRSFTPLITAAFHGHLGAFNILVERGAVVDVVDKDGRSVVFVAAQNNRIPVLKTIISNRTGAKLCQATDSSHSTPLHIAAAKGNLEVVEVLLKAGVKITARNDLSKTPTHLAAENGHIPILRKFISYNEDVIFDEDEDGNTPLHVACINGHLKIARVLTDHGVDVEARNAVLWTPMDCAANGGWDQLISLLLDAGADIDPTDRSKITPLHLAAREGHVKVVNLLISHGADVTSLDSNQFNALDLAIENGHEDVAMAIVKGPKWALALRNVTDAQWGGVTTPFRKLIRKMPEVAEAVLSRCTLTNVSSDTGVRVDSDEYRVFFNYEFLEDFRDPESRAKAITRAITRRTLRRGVTLEEENDDESETQSAVGRKKGSIDGTAVESDAGVVLPFMGRARGYTTDWGPVGFSKSRHPLSIMVESARTDLLKHPLVTSLLNYKWQHFGRYFYFGNLFIYLIFLAYLTTFALTVHSPLEMPCNSTFLESCRNPSLSTCDANVTDCSNVTNATGNTNTVTINCCQQSGDRSRFLYVAAGVIIVFAVIRILMELFQVVQLRHYYFFSWINWIEMILFVCSIIFVWIFHDDCLCPRPWQWQVGAVAVFLGWIDLIVFIRKLPLLGIYVVMLVDIMYTFCRLIVLTVLLVIAFALVFYMCFYDPGFSRTPFSSPGYSLLKTMTMTTGEFEFDSIFRLQSGGSMDQETIPNIAFPPVSYILWIIFLILMPILLTNLLVGLAVDDIKGIQEAAVLKRLALQVELALSVEELFPKRLRRFFIIGTRVSKPNRNLTPWEHFRYQVWGGERFDSSESISSALQPPLDPVEQVQRQTRTLVTDVDKMKQTLHDMSERNLILEGLIQEMAKRQGIVPNDVI